MNFFHGRKVWIIGATSGIGRDLAFALHSEGADVVASGRNQEYLGEMGLQSGGEIETLQLDVSDLNSLSQAVGDFAGKGCLPDTVIYMAGFYEPVSIDQMNANDLEQTLKVNLWAAMELCRQVLPLFYDRGRGQIALVASVAGYRGLPNGQPYSASKAALINFAESMRIEAAPKGIDIKVVCPGFVATPMTAKNSFEMPDVISSEEAAKCVADGLASNRFEILFPKKFGAKMKLLRFLPYRLYFRLLERMKT